MYPLFASSTKQKNTGKLSLLPMLELLRSLQFITAPSFHSCPQHGAAAFQYPAGPSYTPAVIE